MTDMRTTATPLATKPTQFDSTITRLRGIDLFDGATPSELGELARTFTTSTARPGQSFDVQDTPVHWWNIIVNGHAVVVRDGTPLGLLGHGASWSEHSLLNQQRTPISVVALSPVTVLSITQAQFNALPLDHPLVWARIVARSATSADRLALPVYRALVHMEQAEEARRRAGLTGSGLGWPTDTLS
jgi:CRP-like cAMP-binding protein